MQTQSREFEESFQVRGKMQTLKKLFGCPPGIRNPDMLIQSQISPSENKENKDLHSAKRDQLRQNTHTGRTRKDEDGL